MCRRSARASLLGLSKRPNGTPVVRVETSVGTFAVGVDLDPEMTIVINKGEVFHAEIHSQDVAKKWQGEYAVSVELHSLMSAGGDAQVEDAPPRNQS